MSKNVSHKVFDGSALPGIEVLAERLVAVARRQHVQLVTVESCTAGAMAHALSRPFGAALVLAGGFVTYTKAAKEKLVGVPGPLLAEYTAVHAEAAKAMAVGALKRSGADCAIAITGVTGSSTDRYGTCQALSSPFHQAQGTARNSSTMVREYGVRTTISSAVSR